MTDIEKKALERYPEYCCNDDYREEKALREGYKTACEEYESLQKIHGWVARTGCCNSNILTLFESKPERNIVCKTWVGHTMTNLHHKLFPEITWDSEPVEVELLIRKV